MTKHALRSSAGVLAAALMLALFCLPLQGQDKKLGMRGRVFENMMGRDSSLYEYPVPQVQIMAYQGGDSTSFRTDILGVFNLRGLKPGETRLKFVKKGFYDQNIILDLQDDEGFLYVELFRRPEQIKEAHIRAVVPPMTHRKDTIIYNAAAIPLSEGENAVEILRQMPGVEIKNGKIYVNGQEVKRTYVNGRLIYGDNAMAPLGAIVAEDVTHIKSYEELSVEDRLKGRKNGQKDRVLDITTKEAVFSAFDGHVLASGGADAQRNSTGRIQPRYQGGLSARFFSESLLWSVKFNANNIGRSDNEVRSVRTPYGPLNTYNDRLVTEVALTKYWGDRLLGSSFYADYTFMRDASRTFRTSRTSYFPTGDSPAREYADTASSSSTDGRHSLTMNLSLQNAKVKSLSVNSTLGFTKTGASAYSGSRSWTQDATMARTSQTTSSQIRDLSYAGRFIWRNPTAESGWNPYAMMEVSLGGGKSGEIVQDTLKTSTHRRKLDMASDKGNWYVGVNAGVERVLVNSDSLTIALSPGINLSTRSSKTKSLSYDVIDPDNPLPDAVNTYDYTYHERKAATGTSFHVSRADGKGLVAGLFAGLSQVSDAERIPVATGFSKYFFVPQAYFALHSKSNWISYDLHTNLPSLEQLRDRIDDRNPMFLQGGNPALRASYQHQLRLSGYLPLDSKVMPANLRVEVTSTVTTSPVVSNSMYYGGATHLDGWGGYDLLPGTTFTTYANGPASVLAGVQASYVLRLQPIKSNLLVNAGYTFSTSPQYVSGTLMRNFDSSPSAGLEWNYRTKPLSFRAEYGLAYLRGSNTLGQTIVDRLAHSFTFTAHASFLKYFFIDANSFGSVYHYLAGGLQDRTVFALSACAGASLMKGRLVISVSANDLLNRSTTYSETTAADRRVQSWTPAYGRYYMLNVAFRLNKTSKRSVFKGFAEWDDSFRSIRYME